MERDPRHVSERQPLRLLWLIDSLTVGGAEALTIRFARASRARSIELTVCSRTSVGANELEDDLRKTGVDVVNLKARKLVDRRPFREFLRLLDERKITLIHAHLTYAAIWGAVAARRTGIPLVASLHAAPRTDDSLKGRLREWMMTRLLNRNAARVVLVSQALAAMFAEAGLAREKSAVIHNGIDIPSVSERGAFRRELGASDDTFLITTVAVLRQGKGIDVLLRAAARIAAEEPRARFVIVGDGPEQAKWQSLAREIGVDHAVIWTGFRRDVDAILRDSDLFVLPTLADAFPTVLIEAMASGLPIVASDVGGVPEIVDPATGRLVSPADAGALAEAIESAMTDEVWRSEARRAGEERFRARFTTGAWVGRLERLYAEVVAEQEAGDRRR